MWSLTERKKAAASAMDAGVSSPTDVFASGLPLVVREPRGHLGPRADPQLPEDLPQVVLDRPPADRELERDFGVRGSGCHEARDPQLVWRETILPVQCPREDPLACRYELDPRTLVQSLD